MKQFLLKGALCLMLVFLFLPFRGLAENMNKDEVIEVETLEELRNQEADGETVYLLTGEPVLIYQQGFRNKKWIQDETAGLEIDDPAGVLTTTFDLGDGLSGLKGTLTVYRNNYQFVPVENLAEASSTGNEMVAVERTLEDLSADDQGRLVKIIDLVFDEEDQGEPFGTGNNYDVTDPSGDGVFRTEFFDADYIGAPIPEAEISVTAVVHMFFDNIQITARSLADLGITDMHNVAALHNQDPDGETIYTLTEEVILTYQQDWRNNKWIQDDTAGILIDDNAGIITSTYEINDGITGIRGTLTSYRNNLQFLPVEDPGPATSHDNEPLVVERTLETLSADDQGRLVHIEGVLFDEDYHGDDFGGGNNYNISDASGSGVFRTNFYDADYIGTPIPTTQRNVTALVGLFFETIQLTARSLDDFEALDFHSVTFVVNDEAGEAIEDAVVTFDGEAWESGEYFMEDVPEGSYSYAVEKEGYQTESGTILLEEDKTIEVMLVVLDPDRITEIPWTEAFDGDEFPPAGWSHYTFEDDGGWEVDGESAHHNFLGSEESADSWLITPQIELPEDETILMQFLERNQFMNTYGYSAVMISKGSGNPANEHFVEIHESDQAHGELTETTVNLGQYAGEIVYLAFVYQGEGTDTHRWWIDEVTLEQAPDVFEVPDLATLREEGLTDGTTYRVTGEVILTHQNGNRNQKFFQDDTGAILIDDDAGVITTEYDKYDGITGLTGTLGVYNAMLQLVPEEDPGEATSSGNTVTPREVTLEDLNPDHQSMLVLVKGVSIEADEGETFSPSTSYAIHDATAESEIRTPNVNAGLDYFDWEIPSSAQDITAVVTQFQTTMQLMPRSTEDFKDTETSTNPEPELAAIQLYPNPATSQIRVEHADSRIDQVRIFNLGGQMVREVSVNDHAVSIDLYGLNTGMYIVQVVAGDTVVTRRLQVNR